MTEKLKVDELLRLACLYAEQDRYGFAEANFKGTPEYEEAMSHAEQIRAYRLKRWGKTQHEVLFENAKLVPVRELRAAVETSVGDPLAAVRWICSDCNTVNGIDRTNCNGCQLSRELSEKHFAVNTGAALHEVNPAPHAAAPMVPSGKVGFTTTNPRFRSLGPSGVFARPCSRCGKEVRSNDPVAISATVLYCSIECAD